MTDEYETTQTSAELPTKGASAKKSSADSIVAKFHAIDRKVNAMREKRLNDPDSLGDKILKFTAPAIAGLVAGHLFQFIWDKSASHVHGNAGGSSAQSSSSDAQQGFLSSLVFAACSAAFGAVITQLSDRGSKAFVEHRHRKAAQKEVK